MNLVVATLVAEYGEHGIQSANSIEPQASHDEVKDESPFGIPDPFAPPNPHDYLGWAMVELIEQHFEFDTGNKSRFGTDNGFWNRLRRNLGYTRQQMDRDLRQLGKEIDKELKREWREAGRIRNEFKEREGLWRTRR